MRLTPGWFIVRVAVESLVLRLAVIVLLYYTVGDTSDTNVTKSGFFFVVVFAPILETLLLQSLPVRIAEIFTGKTDVLFLCAWLPFALLHFTNSFLSGIGAGLIGGYYIAFTYVVFLRRSHGQAFFATAAVHALGNAICYIVARAL